MYTPRVVYSAKYISGVIYKNIFRKYKLKGFATNRHSTGDI